jgi:hypothetical protein
MMMMMMIVVVVVVVITWDEKFVTDFKTFFGDSLGDEKESVCDDLGKYICFITVPTI